MYNFITHTHGSHGGKVFTSVCLCVCVFFCTMTQKLMQLGLPNFTQKYSTMITGNPLILGTKGQGQKSQKHCRHGSLHSCES